MKARNPIYSCSGLWFGVLLAVLPTFLMGAESSSNRVLRVPATTALPVAKMLFEYNSKGGLMGDGVSCTVAEIEESAFLSYYSAEVRPSWDWKAGAVPEKMPELWTFIAECLKLFDVYDKFSQAFDINETAGEAKTWSERNSSGFISNAKLWIVVPERRLLCIIVVDT